MAGEVSWRVPSLSLADDAIELFSDRARRTKPDFRVTADNTETVTEICRRLDGLPLAIELAAARIRALSPTEILDSLHDQFRLLTGGARTAVRRQQTLRASVDWSHALLSEPEQVLFRQAGGVLRRVRSRRRAGRRRWARWSATKCSTSSRCWSTSRSWWPTTAAHGTRYRLLETVRQYAQEKLARGPRRRRRAGASPRPLHRDGRLAGRAGGRRPRRRIEWAEAEIDNLRAAFAWSRERHDAELALTLASSLQPLWLTRGRVQEGLNWLSAALASDGPPSADASAARVRATADKALLLSLAGSTEGREDAEQALASCTGVR